MPESPEALEKEIEDVTETLEIMKLGGIGEGNALKIAKLSRRLHWLQQLQEEGTTGNSHRAKMPEAKTEEETKRIIEELVKRGEEEKAAGRHKPELSQEQRDAEFRDRIIAEMAEKDKLEMKEEVVETDDQKIERVAQAVGSDEL